ncbi:MAG TPA: ABC transporter substrate-binding protein [Candidatus Nitrosotalea sp.]|nr:ABC transporter substrate-binding protein [Candidatus Nitrosotalea sp.]
MFLTKRARLGLGLAATLLLAACGGSASTGGTAATTTGNHPNLSGQTIRFVYDGTPALSTVNLDHAFGILKSWGANVQVTYAGSTQVVFAAMVQGDADVMEFSAQGALAGIDSGINLKAFALVNPRMDYAFISKPSIKKLSQLKGAKIGVLDTVGLNGIQAEMVVKAAGLKSSDVSLIAAGGQGQRVAALLSGRLDATMVGFSNYLQLKSQGYNLLYSYTKEQPKLYDGILWSTPTWLSSHKATAIAINQALIESSRWVDNTKNKSAFVTEADNLIKGSDASVTGQMYDTYIQNNMFPPNAILDQSALSFNQSEYVQYKALKESLPVSQWSDVTFAQQALKKEGTV